MKSDMGGDGGSIPKRDDLVRTRGKQEQVSKSAELQAKWKHCAITQQPLMPPIVACELGRLYNKEAVIEFLLNRSKSESASKFNYVRGLKDIKELRLTANPAFRPDASKAGDDVLISPYICPVTGLEMNGRYKFCFLMGCGCVFSDRALKEIKDSICVNCGKAYVDDDIIVINGTDEEISDLQTRLENRRLAAKASRKRKVQSAAAEVVASSSASAGSSADASFSGESVTATKSSVQAASAAASVTSSKAYKPGSGEKKPRTIQDDPQATEVFKSLFNTHKTAKQQQQAHWVTYNPQYF